ncbi:hypothetical protein SPHS6_02798 [Sphingobium sp. S6]|nr:hypothetical protein SPHS6_02798 [Sphingobium sp. S6]CAD7340324.1 hypothetical protein SPHS8_03035 [Sphingobium sp. S8]
MAAVRPSLLTRRREDAEGLHQAAGFLLLTMVRPDAATCPTMRLRRVRGLSASLRLRVNPLNQINEIPACTGMTGQMT